MPGWYGGSLKRRNRSPIIHCLSAIASLALIFSAPIIFSYLNMLTEGQYVRPSPGSPWEWVPKYQGGSIIAIALGICIWILAVILIIGLVANPARLKREMIFPIILLTLGLITFQENAWVSLWIKQNLNLTIDPSYLPIGGVFGIFLGVIPLVVDIISGYQRFGHFVRNLTIVKRANVSLERTEFRVLNYKEKSEQLLRKARTFKLVFRLLALSAIILCLYYTYQNITYFVGIPLSIDQSSTRGLVVGTIALIQNVFTLYLISIIPLTIILVFISGLILRTRASDEARACRSKPR